MLLTGAAGSIATAVRPGLRVGLDELRLSDARPVEGLLAPETDAPADLADAAAVARAVQGVDAVVHLGAVADEAAFDVLAGPNLHGTFHVFEAARRAGVRRVVFASSHRACGFEPTTRRLAGGEPPRPDGLYGTTKVFGEALGRMYADKFGLEVVAVRIGVFAQRPSTARHRHAWLSPGDATRLLRACLTAPGVTYACVYGASANTRGWWDLGPARALGYDPQDDAEDHPEARDAQDEGPPLQGGAATLRSSGGWAG